MKKIIITIVAIVLSIIGGAFILYKYKTNDTNDIKKVEPEESITKQEDRIEPTLYNLDINNNQVDDVIDMLEAAKKEVDNKVTYLSSYRMGGYPPEEEGVCTDVIWRALKNAGIDLKSEMDNDIKTNTLAYRNGVTQPDPNIDFRRVKNQHVYFERFYTKLTTEVNPDDKENLKEWQPGDIIVKSNNEHVAMVSDKVDDDGVPYVLHNYYNHATEDNYLLDWHNSGYIVAHYRLKADRYR